MNVFTAVLLGFIQGISEFLPISSSGHLVIAQSLLPGFSQPGALFDAILHFGTLFAVLFYFRNKLFSYSAKFWLFIIIGTIPAVFAALFFGDALEALFSGTKWVGVALIVTGGFNFLVDKFIGGDRKLNFSNSFSIGIAQAIAIIPGISRSGSTIVTGTALGLDRKVAAEYSFILSVPAILGANIFQIYKYGDVGSMDVLPYIFGFTTAFISGFLSIRVLLLALMEKKFKYFGFYCVLLGVLAILIL